MNIDVKILDKILRDWIQQYIERIIQHDHLGFISGLQGFFNICINQCDIPHWVKTIWSSKLKQKMLFDKIQHPFMTKSLQRGGIEGIYLNMIKVIYDKPTVNIIHNGEKLKAFPLRTETRQGCPLLFFFPTILEVLATALRKQKGIKIGKEGKLSLFVDDILYIKNPNDATRKLFELINEFGKVAR